MTQSFRVFSDVFEQIFLTFFCVKKPYDDRIYNIISINFLLNYSKMRFFGIALLIAAVSAGCRENCGKKLNSCKAGCGSRNCFKTN